MLCLRNEVLRKPLSLNLFNQELSKECDYLHFALIKEDKLVACLM